MNRIDVIKRIFGSRLELDQSDVIVNNKRVGTVNGCLKFIEDDNDSSETFDRQWQEFSTLRHDDENNNRIKNVLIHRTGWDLKKLKGKLILECGSGAGADSDVLINHEASLVSVDLSTNILEKNQSSDKQVIIQASIDDLPFEKNIFDVVFCHRVIMHTKSPQLTLEHILEFVKPGGSIFIHSYARNFDQMANWKYFLRPLTKRMNKNLLFYLINQFGPFLMKLNSLIRSIPPDKFGKFLFKISNRVIPIRNYHLDSNSSLANYNHEEIVQLSIHDTFDALSPKYDNPLSWKQMEKAALDFSINDFEIIQERGVTILRNDRLDKDGG